MENLTAEQVKELADNFMLMANALGNYRYNNIDSLTDAENIKIKEIHNEQLASTTELYTKAAVLVLEDATGALHKIETITAETQNLYEKLTKVQTVLDRASSILNLASAILTLDVRSATSHIQDLVS